MSRYIEADKAKARFKGWKHERSICEEIDAVESVDAVPVVRCYECKHSCRLDGTKILYQCDHNGVRPNYWFCADGEKVTLETAEWIVELGNSYPKFKKMLVRCKDCKWLDYCDTQEGREYLCCREGFPVDLNDFCSWGEEASK